MNAFRGFSFRSFLFLLALFLLVLPESWSQEVKIGPHVVFRVEDDLEAERVETLLLQKLEKDRSLDQIHVEGDKEEASLYWGETLLVQIDSEQAEIHDSTPEDLVILWAKQLKRAIKAGEIKLSQDSLVGPPEFSTWIDVGGFTETPLEVSSGDSVVEVSVEGPRSLTVSALKPGRTTLKIRRGPFETQLPVWVKPWAGEIPSKVSVRVAGHPCPGVIVEEAVRYEIAQHIQVEKGNRWRFSSKALSLPSVTEGDSMVVPVKVWIGGSRNYYPIEGEVRVEVESHRLSAESYPEQLLVSNRPERLKTNGILLREKISSEKPSRLMYSHMNAQERNKQIVVMLKNQSSQEAEVLLGHSFAGPNHDEVYTGHQAAQRYLRGPSRGAGFILEVPARGSLILADHLVAPEYLVSGFMTFNLLQGKELEVEVLAMEPGRHKTSAGLVELKGGVFDPFKIHPHGHFDTTVIREWITFDKNYDGEAVELLYGYSPWVIDQDTALPNTGNFGVEYQWEIELKKDCPYNRFALYFETVKGPAALSLNIADQEGFSTHEVSFINKGERRLVDYIALDKDEKKVVITTLPEASSYYPAKLILLPVKAGSLNDR